MLEEHHSSNPAEEFVRFASSGDLGRVEEMVRGGTVAIDNQFNGHTALQAASQVRYHIWHDTALYYDIIVKE